MLGSQGLRYRAYAQAVREECADIPDEVFKPARAQVLSDLVDGAIFHTEPSRARWEEQARHKVAEEIAELIG